MTSPGPLTSGQERGARSREEILDAAERLMGANGYSATSMSALAKESGLPASSIYWHFGSKSGVLGAVMERGARRFFESATPPDPGGPADPCARLGQLIGLSVVSMRHNRVFLRLVIALLLGAAGEHGHNDVVARVREQARVLLLHGLAWAYAPWGDQLAQQVADTLTSITMTLLDGIFIAIEADGDSAVLVSQTTAALHTLAESTRGASPA